MSCNFIEPLKNYFIEREKLSLLDGWIGKSTAAPMLTPIYMAIRQLKISFLQTLRDNHLSWTVQASIGQGFATPDHYIALLPPGEKVSNGIYFCVCFDRIGAGCVMGVMTSIKTNQRIDDSTIVRAKKIHTVPESTWEMIPPNQINVWGRNNAFFSSYEITKDIIAKDNGVDVFIVDNILQSKLLISQLATRRKKILL